MTMTIHQGQLACLPHISFICKCSFVMEARLTPLKRNASLRYFIGVEFFYPCLIWRRRRVSQCNDIYCDSRSLFETRWISWCCLPFIETSKSNYAIQVYWNASLLFVNIELCMRSHCLAISLSFLLCRLTFMRKSVCVDNFSFQFQVHRYVLETSVLRDLGLLLSSRLILSRTLRDDTC